MRAAQLLLPVQTPTAVAEPLGLPTRYPPPPDFCPPLALLQSPFLLRLVAVHRLVPHGGCSAHRREVPTVITRMSPARALPVISRGASPLLGLQGGASPSPYAAFERIQSALEPVQTRQEDV
jgi:hypothetical protein